ncbi:hypothetical protein [Streptomyces sp. NPDC051636]|uniref:hypothetical protein n=1 Tax=Streptomyces sp. NPDC051636 TaxID=3365663 RepID=UPI00378A1518
MRAVDNATGVNGTRLPIPPPIEASIEHGFLLEVLRYASTITPVPEPVVAPRILPCARDAVRAIRIQVRTAHAAGMTPRETMRAIEWVESGWMHALALLHTGNPCGFTVVLHGGAVAEWSVRPLRYLSMAPGISCPVNCPAARTELIS